MVNVFLRFFFHFQIFTHAYNEVSRSGFTIQILPYTLLLWAFEQTISSPPRSGNTVEGVNIGTRVGSDVRCFLLDTHERRAAMVV